MQVSVNSCALVWKESFIFVLSRTEIASISNGNARFEPIAILVDFNFFSVDRCPSIY